ncbi:MAG: ribosomal protein S18-alanine N-acetyltransferase [Oscillospiraceae bacterium]|jgi:ribosomal-protein-alanine N-acetyltransferase|nr:ribosomal protein S18-alanine N-acetyltransferase [Oscillospiraceae bacterium]
MIVYDENVVTEDEMIIRSMRAEDIDAVHQIERLVFIQPWTRESFERELTANKNVARYLVVECQGRVIGYGGMWLVMEEGHITNVAIHPDFHGQGFGSALVDAMLITAQDLGIVYITLECRKSNLNARHVYEQHGFTYVGLRKRYYEDNQEDAALYVHQNVQTYVPMVYISNDVGRL